MDVTVAILIFSTLVGASGTIYGLGRLKAEKTKIQAEAEKVDVDAVAVISNSAIALLGPMEKQVKSLESRLTQANKRAGELENKYETASAELTETAKKLTETLARCNELEVLTEKLLSELRRHRLGDH